LFAPKPDTMFKFVVAALLFVAVYAGGDDAPYNVADFQGDMQDFKDAVLGASNEIERLEGMAIAALADTTQSQWGDFETEFRSMLETVGQAFEAEEKRMVEVIGGLWSNPGDFLENDLCDSVATLAEDPSAAADLGLAFAVALIEDLGCFKYAFRGAEAIDTAAMVAGTYYEHEAVNLIAEGFEAMHQVKQAGERFYDALETLDAAYNGDSSRKREMARLLRMLTKLSRK